MDEHTFAKLEFNRIRVLLSEHAQCALGRSLALHIRPSKRISQVTRWLEQLAQFQQWVELHGLPPFGGIRDVRPLVRRAVPPEKLEPEQFADLAGTLMGIDAVRRYMTFSADEQAGCAQHFDTIARLAGRIGDFRVIAQRIGRVIDRRGKIRDDATERLGRLRETIADVRRRAREVFDRLTREPSIVRYLQYPNPTFHADRMVLPLKADQRGRVAGIIHRSSDSGQTLFVEPAEVVELNNRRINLLESERDEINRILWELTHLVHLNQRELLHTLDAIALVDLITAKVQMGRHYQMTLAKINERNLVRLRQARNPILMAMYDDDGRRRPEEQKRGNGPIHAPNRKGSSDEKQKTPQAPTQPSESMSHDDLPRRVVPIDIRLGEDFDIMIITGPNTGGKTASLKTMGLLALMTQSGLPIPAEAGATMPVFEGIWIDVGDEQSLQQSLSTFSAHLARILDILQRARRGSLVLLDELGSGTDPEEGAAIGKAVIEYLVTTGCRAMITTHLGALKALGYQSRRIDNAAVQFDVETLQPAFELRIGEPGNSHAIAIASRLGMPAKMVHAARRHLSGHQKALKAAIAGTLSSRRQAERARRDAEEARQQAARQALAALDKAKAFEEKYRAYSKWVQRVMTLQPGDQVHVQGYDEPGRLIRIRHDKQRASVSIGAVEVEVPISYLRFGPN